METFPEIPRIDDKFERMANHQQTVHDDRLLCVGSVILQYWPIMQEQTLGSIAAGE